MFDKIIVGFDAWHEKPDLFPQKFDSLLYIGPKHSPLMNDN